MQHADHDGESTLTAFVTLFDEAYAPQGLALLRSLRLHSPHSALWVVALDSTVSSLIAAMDDPAIRVIPLPTMETKPLLRAKPNRSMVGYYWTLTPFAVQAVFDRDSACQEVTYVDADMWLRGSPAAVVGELTQSGAAALITRHDFSPRYDQTVVSGEFCVQFMPFTRRALIAILPRWQSQCLDWCDTIPTGGRFGDQKYLDEWPALYADEVRILSNESALGAPWNADRRSPDEVVAYHFHGLRLLSRQTALLTSAYELPAAMRRGIYAPYLEELSASMRFMEAHGTSISTMGGRKGALSIARVAGAAVARWRVRSFLSAMAPVPR